LTYYLYRWLFLMCDVCLCDVWCYQKKKATGLSILLSRLASLVEYNQLSSVHWVYSIVQLGPNPVPPPTLQGCNCYQTLYFVVKQDTITIKEFNMANNKPFEGHEKLWWKVTFLNLSSEVEWMPWFLHKLHFITLYPMSNSELYCKAQSRMM
jgi:hypothetical protein